MRYRIPAILLIAYDFAYACAGAAGVAPTPSVDVVFLVHGLGRTRRSMAPLARNLERHGFRVRNIGYPSRKGTIDELSAHLGGEVARAGLRADQPYHVVSHSLGGILVRYCRSQGHLPDLARAVMLCPPSQGSEVTDRLKENPLYHLFLGPTASRLGTDPQSLPNALPPVDFELGVIAGDRSLNPLYSWWVSGKDDGKVSVARAKVEGMADFLVMPHSHSFIMASDEVAEQVAFFLRTGHFRRDEGAGPSTPESAVRDNSAAE